MIRTGNTIIVPTLGGWQAHDVSGVLPPVVEYPPVSTGRLWANLDPQEDWGRDSLWIDVMRTARPWRAQTSTQFDDATLRAQMMAAADADGYPTMLPAGVLWAGTMTLMEQDAASASAIGGRYRLEWTGQGTVLVSGDSQTNGFDSVTQKSWIEFNYTPNGSNSIDARISETTQGNHVRGMRCYMIQHAALLASGQVVHPAFKAKFGSLKLLRWMMAQGTNTSTHVNWSDAPTPTSICRGISYAEMISASNELGMDMWLCVPHMATPDYVTALATLVRDSFNPFLAWKVEYSNELWNYAWNFHANPYLVSQAAQRGYDWDVVAGGRIAETMQAVTEVFAGQMHRVSRVLGVQTGFTSSENNLLYAPAWVAEQPGRPAPHTLIDAVAVTGYFNNPGAQWPGVIAAATSDYATGRALLVSNIEADIEDHRTRLFPYWRTLCTSLGKQLIMYEGGSHLFDPGSTGNSALAQQLVTEVNSGPLVVGLYEKMLTAWGSLGDAPFCQFTTTHRYEATGSFGLLPHIAATSPRYEAMLNYNAGTFPAAAPAVGELPLNQRLVISGHSIPDATARDPLAAAITAMGGAVQKWTATGPHSSAQWRWDNAVAVGTPDNVKALLEAGGPYDVFMGTESHGGSYTNGADTVGRASVLANTTQYSPPAQSGANVYALLWHNLAASTGAQPYYLTFWRNDPPRIFGAAWRAAQEPEKPLWDSIFSYVNSNKAVGTPNMLRVPLLEVFCAVYDAIQSGTVTGITMADLFSDDVHIDTPIGRWVSLATQVAVLYRRNPSELPANAGTLANISPALAAQLRPIIWATCLADPRTGLAA